MALTYGDIASTTLENRAGVLADNITKQVALFLKMKQSGNIKPVSGGSSIQEEIEYAENGTVAYYSGYEEIDITPQTTFTKAEYQIKQLAGSFSMSGLEELENAGEEQVIDLMSSRLENLERSLVNTLGQDVYATGLGSGGKQIGGLQHLVPDDPTSGTVGGIDAAVETWWQSKVVDFSVLGLTASAATIKRVCNKLKLQLTRGSDKPNLASADNTFYEYILEALQSQQQFQDPKLAEAGFENVVFQGIPVLYDGGADGGCPSSHLYMVNTKYLKFRPHRKRNMVPIGGKREPVNQDAFIKLVGWAGNITCSNRSKQGVIIL